MAWQLNRALTNLRAEVNACWPGRDRTSDGTIGDAAHQSTSSDHNPDGDGSVDAWDMDIDGVDVWHIIDRFEQHEAARYWIYNRQIASRSTGWTRERYTGSNPHDKHVHFNTLEGHEDSTKPWGVWPVPQEEDMATVPEIVAGVWGATAAEYEDENSDGTRQPITRADALYDTHGRLIRIERALATLAPLILNVDEEVLARLGDATVPAEQIADVLRPVLGDRAAAVGQALLDG